ncbi:unnamed protein product [Caenorhabditis angaria]|uniref:Uncharacterized protein n=1 Tax=Caenorhabditis angaria TaxID=860376 RepID=A0A9P1I4I5_9PELO|nr:unnamed protein product [Caenorhabditis angaria]
MSQQQFGKNFEKGVEATSLVPGGGVVKTRSDRKHGGTESARSLAQVYRNKLIESKDQLQVAAARELFRYVNGDLKDEPPEFIESFLSTLDGRTEAGAQSAVYNATKSASIEQKKAGIFMIVCLADHQGLIRYANYLLKMLNSGGMDEETVKMGCRALAYLIMTSKTYAAELVDRCMDHCTEWLQFPDDRVSLLDENRRLAAVHLSRELAIFTPTAFFLRANLFFKYIFNALRDKSPTIRIAAIEALHSVLTIISQREAKQKTEWYKECFDEAFNIEKGETPRDEQDRYHSVAVLLNELLRISDQAYEHVRIESSKFEKPQKPHDDPITWIVLHRYSDTVESVTSRQLVKENFKDILGCIRKIIEVVARKSKGGGGATTQKNLYLTTVLMQLLPRVCAFTECDASFRQLAFETAFNSLNKLPIAAPAVGMMMLSNPELHKSYIPQVIGYVTNALKKSLDQADFYFTFLFLFVDAYNQEITEQIKSLLPILLDLPLSRGLTNVLKMIMMRIPKLRLNVQDGVMASVYLNLTGVPVPPKSEPAGRPPPPRNILQKAMNDQKELDKVVLSIDTLGEFYFSRGALQRIMQYVADYYLVAENVEIRMAAVKCCCDMIVPFMRVYKKVTTDKRHHLLATIHGVLRALVSLIVVDPHVDVRMQVIRCFSGVSHQFLVHLAQPEMLEVQFMALHDEKLEMQQACVTLLGRLAELNPALVFPRMRRMLLETLSQLTHSGQPRLEQHSAKMIAQIANQSPKFLRPYIGSMLAALIPKLRSELKKFDPSFSLFFNL